MSRASLRPTKYLGRSCARYWPLVCLLFRSLILSPLICTFPCNPAFPYSLYSTHNLVVPNPTPILIKLLAYRIRQPLCVVLSRKCYGQLSRPIYGIGSLHFFTIFTNFLFGFTCILISFSFGIKALSSYSRSPFLLDFSSSIVAFVLAFSHMHAWICCSFLIASPFLPCISLLLCLNVCAPLVSPPFSDLAAHVLS
jgi:hypothetical protein